jgi:hypothetical protein
MMLKEDFVRNNSYKLILEKKGITLKLKKMNLLLKMQKMLKKREIIKD